MSIVEEAIDGRATLDNGVTHSVVEEAIDIGESAQRKWEYLDDEEKYGTVEEMLHALRQATVGPTYVAEGKASKLYFLDRREEGYRRYKIRETKDGKKVLRTDKIEERNWSMAKFTEVTTIPECIVNHYTYRQNGGVR